MADVAMPRLSDSMEEGTILKWLKSDGDSVERGEELVEIETDKANMTYEADQAGTLKIVAQEGDTLAVGATIAKIGDDAGDEDGDGRRSEEPGAAEETEEESQAAGSEREPGRGAEDAAESADVGGGRGGGPRGGAGGDRGARAPRATAAANGRVKASPVARRMAQELGVDLGSLKGTGPGGRIVKSDVEAAAQNGGGKAEEPAPAADGGARPRRSRPRRRRTCRAPVVSGDRGSGRGETTIEELTRLQQTIARRMAESKATAPEFVLTLEVDMGEAVEFRKQLKAAAGEGGVAPSFNDFVVKASALALREFPRANGAYRDGKFELYSRVNVGIAVAGQDALIVPTIFDADSKSLGEIARDARALAERVRAGRDHPARALLGHVQRLQPGHVRHQALRRGDQPAAGGDPRRGRDDAAAGGPRRRGRGPAGHGAHAHLRPPHPLRRRRRPVPRPHPRAAREPALLAL